jgi:adenosylcobinamide-GDP ribazoletransferase
LGAAAAHFSILPVRPSAGPPGPGALAALPIVGVALGAAAGGAGALAARAVSPPLGGVVAFGTLALLTGAIHLDGFLDGCDAFFASVPPARRLEILKDPRDGSFAVAGMFVMGGVAVAALAAIPPKRLPASLAFAAGLARAASVTGAFVFPGAGSRGERTHFNRSVPVVLALTSTLVALALAIGRVDRRAALGVPAAIALALACERWICGRLGGLVGDAYGFTIVVTEVATLVALATRREPPAEDEQAGDATAGKPRSL